MSAPPNQGRQSPEPEHQTDSQVGSQHKAELGTGKVGTVGDSESKTTGKEDQTAGLSSNPKPPLEDFVKEKFEKK
ncbi:hypothetical protein DV738_g4787, partial [Chaetothyriales sp. CBS 135597]